jgi:hypothetical protein
MQGHIQQNDKSVCGDDFLRIAPHPPYSPGFAPSDFLTFSCLSISKTASKDSNSSMKMNFFQESEKFRMESTFSLWKWFFRIESTYWTEILQQLESTWNKAYNDSLTYF